MILDTDIFLPFATVGEGATYPTLSAALADGKKYIAVREGEYTEPSRIEIATDGTQIYGYGAVFNEVNYVGECFRLEGNRVLIKGIKVKGNHIGCSDLGLGAAFQNNGHDNRLEDVEVENVTGFGVFGSGKRLLVRDSHFVNVGTSELVKFAQAAIHLTSGADGARIEGNYFTGWNQIVGLWDGVSDCWVTDNTGENNLAYIGNLANPVPRSAFEDYGIRTRNRGNRWLSNTVDGSTGYCMEVASGLDDCTVEGNTFKRAGVGRPNGTRVIGITGDAGGGIAEWTKRVRILNNNVYGSGLLNRPDECVAINSHTENVTVEGNHFYDFRGGATTLTAIDALNSGVVFRNNIFRNCGGDGHCLITVRCNGTVIEGNDLLSTISGTRGIYDGGGATGFKIRNNEVNVPGRALDLTANHTVTDNDLVSSADAVVLLSGNRNTLRGNAIEQVGGGFGLWIQGSRNKLTQN